MKITISLIIVFLFCISSSAQQSSSVRSAPDIKILKKGRSLETPEKGIGGDQFKAIHDQAEARDDLQNPERIRTASGNRPFLSEYGGKPPDYYRYQLKIKNTDTRTIESLGWSYQLIDSSTNQVIEEQWFENRLTLNPGKTATLTARALKIPAAKPSKKDHKDKPAKSFERVVITTVRYTDGTSW